MVQVGTGGKGTRFIKTEWPVEEGTTAGTTRTHELDAFLQPEAGSLVDRRRLKGS